MRGLSDLAGMPRGLGVRSVFGAVFYLGKCSRDVCKGAGYVIVFFRSWGCKSRRERAWGKKVS